MSKIGWVVWCGAICVFCVMVPLVRPASAQGWYLLYPPINENDLGPDRSAPLSNWRRYEALDSAEACEQDRLLLWSEINARDEAGIDKAVNYFVVRNMMYFKALKNPDELERALEYVRGRVRQQVTWWHENTGLSAFLLDAQCVSVADPRLGQPKAAH